MERDTVARVAKVARLKLTEAELEKYGKDLQDILDSFAVLDSAPSSENFDFNPIPVQDVLREDEPAIDIDPYELTKHMDSYDGYIRGPKLS
jgi:aspartyl-tRNA(Asn)/glutamyl-tRNA(Gln) amidotransferase subunit C